jgi:EAL domain-containing protein (putative c-di-GMP-specific phosphodiesterase class I)
VLEQACAQARKWHESGQMPIRIAVNLSARQFGPDLAAAIHDLLRRHELPATWLELEITESMLMNRAERVIDMMGTLSKMGVSLSLDDFGTGYSSLSYLKRFPIETIKIDRSFIKGTPDDGDDCAIAGAIVSMSKQLKLRVIAEGVETAAQVDFMRTLGCDEIQGFLFSPPVVVGEFEAMLLSKKTLPR